MTTTSRNERAAGWPYFFCCFPARRIAANIAKLPKLLRAVTS
jgi:hypothetical protein